MERISERGPDVPVRIRGRVVAVQVARAALRVVVAVAADNRQGAPAQAYCAHQIP